MGLFDALIKTVVSGDLEKSLAAVSDKLEQAGQAVDSVLASTDKKAEVMDKTVANVAAVWQKK